MTLMELVTSLGLLGTGVVTTLGLLVVVLLAVAPLVLGVTDSTNTIKHAH